MLIVGNAAANTLRGTFAADEISGLGGNDALFGRSGRDTVSGGPGADRIVGGEGRDILSGGDGNDLIYGFAATDTVGGQPYQRPAIRRFCLRAGNAAPRWVVAPISLIKARGRGNASQWRKIAGRTSFAGMSK